MEGYSNSTSEAENNNVDVKMEVDPPSPSVNCKAENGNCSPSVPLSSDADQVAPNEGDGEKSSGDSSKIETDNIKATTNGPPVYFSAPNLTKRNVTLQMLLAAGILKPGEGTMSLEYHQQKFVGDLLENGQIRSQETSQTFSSPSAWAIACKQIINPEKVLRKSGCGWASIKYRSLKLDYYKTVWFKRVREGSIDIRNISNGTVSSSDDSDDEGAIHCVLKFGEHYDSSPAYQSAILSGSKVFISCAEFKDMDRLQPFHVKVTVQALALADFHCNITNTECVGYISGHWNGDQNILKLEVIHPVRVLMPFSGGVDCDNERNRIALEIQKLGHEVVGWYHSHPKAPAQPTKDDISRQLDYQIMMKGATEASYIPCVGLIISPMCYTNQDGLKKSKAQLFWVMPPPDNRPLELGRPMHLNYDITPATTTVDTKSLILEIGAILNFYKERKSLVDMNDLSSGRFDKLKETVSSWIPELKDNKEFWIEVRHLFTSPVPPPVKPPPSTSTTTTTTNTTNNNNSESSVKEDEEPSTSSSPKQSKESSNSVAAESPDPSQSASTSSAGLPVSNSASTSASRSASTPSSTGDEPMAT